MDHWSIPQWIMAFMIGMQILFAPIMHGKPRVDPEYNGAVLVLSAVFMLAILGWAGFWS